MYNTSAREAHEFGVQISQSLCQVLAQTVSFIGVLRHQRYHVNIHITNGQHQNLQGSILAVSIGRQCSRIFFPVLSIGSQRDLSQQLWILSPALRFNEGNANLLVITMVAEEYGEVILCTSLHADAVKAVVFEAVTSPALVVVELPRTLGMQFHIGRIIGMNTSVLANIHRTERMAWTYLFPCGTCSPSVFFGW